MDVIVLCIIWADGGGRSADVDGGVGVREFKVEEDVVVDRVLVVSVDVEDVVVVGVVGDVGVDLDIGQVP